MRQSRYTRPKYTPVQGINVTPFVDVVLVLLIVFMISAPLINVGVEVELPQTDAGPIHEKSEPIVISYQKNGAVYVQEKKVAFKELIPHIKMIIQKNSQAEIFLRGDKDLSYGKIMKLSGLLSKHGFQKVSLVTEPL